MRVLAAMSGGVDSAVAAARMVDAGHDVTGVHLALSKNPQTFRSGARGCCSLEDSHDARRAADMLGIPFYVWDFSDRFAADVVDDFVAEYAAGRTPNPCLRCNEKIKFAAVLERGVALGFDAIATGHYATLRSVDGITQLWRSAEQAKDQSYVLGVLNQEQLSRCLFPLEADTAKADVRAEAAARGLYLAKKPDSHDICFIPSGDTAGFLDRHLGTAAGEIVDSSGEVVGAHAGSHRFTVGQRRGLRLGVPAADGAPRYVLGIQPATNRVIVGAHEELAVRRIAGIRPTWTQSPVVGEHRGLVQVRAHGAALPALIEGRDDGISVLLDEPAHGIAPGQAVVCYDGDRGDRFGDDRRNRPLMVGVSGVGSLPGTDFPAAVRLVMDVLAGSDNGVPHLPELPQRGPWAAMIGRTGALLVDLPISLDAGGWRLSDTAGVDSRRAQSTLRDDLDMLQEQAHDWDGSLILPVAGPWTMAASLLRPLGGRVLADRGARRDLAQSLAQGVADHVAQARHRLPHARIGVQVDEPALPAVLAGAVPTEGGYFRHRRVDLPEVVESLAEVGKSAVTTVLHSCAAGLDPALAGRAGFAELSLDQDLVADWDAVASFVDAGGTLRLGCLPTPVQLEPTRDAVVSRVLAALRPLELGEALADRLVLTPACGLAGSSSGRAAQAYRTLVRAAPLVEEALRER